MPIQLLRMVSLLWILKVWLYQVNGESEKVPELPLFPAELGSPASIPRLMKGEEGENANGNGNGSSNAVAYENGKHIPRLLWVAVKDRNDELPAHMQELFKRNEKWIPQVCDNACKDLFMDTYFKGTMIAWVYNLIDLWAFKADIWRYCVLYTYGGVYLDDDSNIQTPLDEVIKETDHLIMSEEGANGMAPCYEADFRLSDIATAKLNKTTVKAVDSAYFHGYEDDGVPRFFHGHTLVNWGLFSGPRHPLMREVLTNIVEVITSEYRRKTVLHITRWDPPHKVGLCSTMFIMTYTLRDLLIRRYFDSYNEGKGKELRPRILTADYRVYGGKCKAIWTGADPDHYAKRMKKQPNLLKSYQPLDVKALVDSLHGKVVMGEGKSKSIYYVDGQTRREFGSFDNFLDCGFTMSDVRHVNADVINRLEPAGAKQCPKE